MIFVIVLNKLTGHYVSANVLLGLLLGKAIGVSNHAISALIYIPLITSIFYLIMKLFKNKYLVIVFLIVAALLTLPILNANGM